MNLPCGWQPEAIHDQRQDLRDFEWALSFGEQLLGGVMEVEIGGF